MKLLMHAVTSLQQYIIAQSISNGAISLEDAKELQIPWLMINRVDCAAVVLCPNLPPAVSLECQADVLLVATHRCCSQFMFCVDDDSVYCETPSCRLDLSPESIACRLAHRRHSNPKVVTQTFVIAWKNLTLDGFEKPVSTDD